MRVTSKRTLLMSGLLVILLAAGSVWAQAPTPTSGWEVFVIREGATEAPFILDNDDYVENAIEIGTTESGQKAGLATNQLNGATVSQIAALHIDRLDDVASSGSLYGPYFNIWVTDGAGHYAVIANEPSNAEWGGDPWDVSGWSDLSTKTCKVYETPGWNNGTSWVHVYAGSSGPLTFADVAGLVIAPPPPAYIQDSANGVGSGAPDELGTDIAYGFTWVFGDTAANYVTGGDGFIVSNYYATTTFNVVNTTQGTSYATIEAALADAVSGDYITVADGTYNPVGTLSVNVGLSLVGASEAGVIINIPTAGGYGFSVGAADVLLENFTLVANTTNENYPIHASGTGNAPAGLDNLTIRNATIQGAHRRTGFDIHGYNHVTLSHLSSSGATGGNGLQVTGCTDVDMDNITSTGNAWGSLAVYCSDIMGRGSDDVVIDGTTLVADGAVFSQDEFGYTNTGVVISGWDYEVTNSHFREAFGYTDSEGYTFFAADQATAYGIATGFTGYEQYSAMWKISTSVFEVLNGLSIQAAIDAADPGDTINVGPGSYVEALLIQKSVHLYGATAGVEKRGYAVPAGYAWDTGVESVITHPDPAGGYVALVDIDDTGDVTFDGFVVSELNAVANANTSLVRVRAQTHSISDVEVVNCIIGPNTNTTSQDGAQGRMGLYIVNNPYTQFGVQNSLFAHNKIFDCKGNGNNVFLWSAYYAYGAAGPGDMTGTAIDRNEIYGSHRSGIETAGGFAHLTISNNEIYGQSGLPGDDPDFLKYGHGILMIRGSSDKISDPLTAYGPEDLLITGNDIHDNQKSGVYMGPKNDSVVFTDNLIHDNGWNGIMLDLEGNFWNPTFENPPVSGDYACYDCSTDVSGSGNEIYGNGTAANPIADYGVLVNGVPSNGFEFDARHNWWGDASGPYHPVHNMDGQGNEVSDYVLFEPWDGMAFVTIEPAASGPYMCGQAVTLTFKLTMDEYTPDVFGYNAIVRAGSVVDWGTITDLLPFGTVNNQFFTFDQGDGSFNIAGSTVGNPTSPISGAGTYDLFSIEFTTAGEGTADITFDGFSLRDPSNAPIPVTPDDAAILVDCTPPNPVSIITAAPHHERVEVGWTHDGTDVAKFRVYRGMWYDGDPAVSAYPEYDDLPGSHVPDRPVAGGLPDPGQGWKRVDNDDLDFPAESFFDIFTDFDPAPPPRGIFFYEVFAVDAAGNISDPAPLNDKATNYWLGDVNGDGFVNPVWDITPLGSAFGTSEGHPSYNAFCDVGPTDDWSRVGNPLTDNHVNFEDLMIFSMNFGVVSDSNKDGIDIAKSARLAWVDYGNGNYALRLLEGAGLKGVHLTAALPAGTIGEVSAGSLLDQQNEMTFLRNLGDALDVNLAVMGVNNGFVGSGDLFLVQSGTPIALEDLSIQLRGADNSSIEVGLDSASDTLTPRVFALKANYPNPFNPMTKISFSLPEAQNVKLVVYGLDGRKVATLVNETREAGLHEVIWTGRDDAGRGVASGTYFYRIDAGPYSQVRKMTLMK